MIPIIFKLSYPFIKCCCSGYTSGTVFFTAFPSSVFDFRLGAAFTNGEYTESNPKLSDVSECPATGVLFRIAEVLKSVITCKRRRRRISAAAMVDAGLLLQSTTVSKAVRSSQ